MAPLPFLAPAGAPTQLAARAQPGQTLPLKPTRSIRFETDEGTWLSLDLSRDGRRIVFELLGDLYVMDASGGAARAIATGLPFDTQPVFSPDGRSIAFVSDRSGADNLWVMDANGERPRQISFRDDDAVLVSPAWGADGRSLYISRYRADLNGFELWRFDLDGSGDGVLLAPIKATPDQPHDGWTSRLGVAPSADGRYLYYAAHVGDLDYGRLPEWTIRRRDLATGEEETLVSAPRSPRPDLVQGTAFRPAISPDGRRLVYATRVGGRTGLRLLDLDTQQDRWLAYPVQQDELMASASRDLLPRYAFTPDGKALILAYGGKIRRLDIASGATTIIPFRASVSVPLGPDLHVPIRQETGPVRARLIQSPEQSPDGRRLAFSALAELYVLDLDGRSRPRRLTADRRPAFQPSWSPDGRSIVYVSWTAKEGGHIWIAPADGSGAPRRLSKLPAYYTNPVFTPAGDAVVALRASNNVRMHSYMEYGALRQSELVKLPLDGGAPTLLAKGVMGGKPHFDARGGAVHLIFADGLNAVPLDGSGKRRRLIQVLGAGWYFAEGLAPADDLKISPDGKWVLAQIAQQLHLVPVPTRGEPVVTLTPRSAANRKLTDVGADFFDWADGGRTISWAVGSTFYRRPLDAASKVSSFKAVVEVPRDVPRGALLLRGATAITMRGDERIENADILVVDDRIRRIGPRGSFAVPLGATVRDISGKFVVPGFIETHDHIADIRRGILDLESWGPLANLAYGVTTAFDPSPLSIDMLAYEDLIDSGRMLGSRIHSTGPAIFSFNEFTTLDEVRQVLSRYRDHYRTLNLKQYRAGNRRVRQWIAMAAHELGMMPTSEGALSMKLNLSQVMDGYAGFEHALTAVPLYKDVVELVARSGTSYTTTLQITNGGPEGQDYFIVRDQPRDDLKLNRFYPRFVVDVKTQARMWRDLSEYHFPKVAEGAAKIMRAGGLIGIGSHGEMPGLGFHWEMHAHAMGGMTPAEVLRAATIGSARTIGRAAEFGSLEPGKYADLVILERDPLADIRNTLAIAQVMKNGRLYDGGSMDEIWPRQKPLERRWYWDDRAPGLADPGVTVHRTGKN